MSSDNISVGKQMFTRFNGQTLKTGVFTKRTSEKKESESRKFKNIRAGEKPKNKVDVNTLPQLSGLRHKTADPVPKHNAKQIIHPTDVAFKTFPTYVPPSGEGIRMVKNEDKPKIQTVAAKPKKEKESNETDATNFPELEDEDGITTITLIELPSQDEEDEDENEVLKKVTDLIDLNTVPDEKKEQVDVELEKHWYEVMDYAEPKKEEPVLAKAVSKQPPSAKAQTVKEPKKERQFKVKFIFTHNIGGKDTREKLFNMYGTSSGERIVEDGVLRCIIDDIDEMEDKWDQANTRSSFLKKLIKDSGSRSLPVIASPEYINANFNKRVKLLVDCFESDPSMIPDKDFNFMFMSGLQTLQASLRMIGGGTITIDDKGQFYISKK